MSDEVIKDLNTTTKIVEYLRKEGRNIVPIVSGTKIPPAGFDLKQFFDKKCDSIITDSDSIAMLHGHISNTFAIDIDMKDGGGWEDAIKLVAADVEKLLSTSFVIKTPKQGIHIIVEPVGELPPKNTSYFNKDGVEIDIKTQGGYTLLPPSIHPEKEFGKYQFISKTLTPKPTDWLKFEKHLATKGFFTKIDLKEKDTSLSQYDYNDLLKGKFRRGERRIKQNSLYIKKRIMNSSKEAASNAVFAVNQKCDPPLSDTEVQNNIESSEKFFMSHAKENRKKYDEPVMTKTEKGKEEIDETSAYIQSLYKFITLRKMDDILVYNGKIYDYNDAPSLIKENAEKLIENCTTYHRNEVINKIKAQTYTDLEKFDSDLDSITIENGILNLDTFLITEHSPDNLTRILFPVEYIKPEHTVNQDTVFEDIEKNLEDTLFWKFLKSSFTIDKKFRRIDFNTLLEITASFFVKRNIDERMFLLLGSGENGKSTYLDYLSSMIGPTNISNITLQDLEEDKFMRADLHGKTANIFSDLQANELRNTGKIKAIASNEPIQVQRKNKNPFSMHAFAKLIFSCNRFPKVYDQTQGFFRRWIIVKMERNFEGDPERDDTLKERLLQNRDEMNRVFSSLVHLSQILRKKNKFINSKKWRDIQKEWNENADPLNDFIDNYIIDSETHVTKRETYKFYKEIMFEKGETIMGIGTFGKAFAEYYEGGTERTGKGATQVERVWYNVGLKKPVQTDLNEYENVN